MRLRGCEKPSDGTADPEPLEFQEITVQSLILKRLFYINAWGDKDTLRKLGKQSKARQNEAQNSKEVAGMGLSERLKLLLVYDTTFMIMINCLAFI